MGNVEQNLERRCRDKRSVLKVGEDDDGDEGERDKGRIFTPGAKHACAGSLHQHSCADAVLVQSTCARAHAVYLV